MKHIHFANYSPAADIVITAICFVIIILVAFSYITKTRSSKLFLTMIGLGLGVSWADILFYTLVTRPEMAGLANWVRCIFHAFLFLIFVYYIAYLCEITSYENRNRYLLLSNTIFAVVILADVITTLRGPTFIVDETGIRFIGRGIFFFAYCAFTVLCLILMFNVRKLLFHRVMLGFFGTMAISFALLFMQGICGQSSFTVTSIFLPVIAIMYFMHSNPYDASLGANDVRTMQDYIRYCSDMHLDFIFLSLYMKDFDESGTDFPPEIQSAVRDFTFRLARHSRLFYAGKGQMILIFLRKLYPDTEKKTRELIDQFFPLYEKYRYDYKIVIGESMDAVSRKNDYVGFIRSIHRSMPECSIHVVDPKDIEAFNRSEYILNELADINRRHDLNDPRVLVYCQPVLNVRSGKYDTAEALMRLKLPETGIVFPDQFIPSAEEHGYIHTLTEIILHKTCMSIRQFIEEGYEVRRISVNVSVSELKNENFCQDILTIIYRSAIPADRIAIELTESQNEDDFNLMKQKISELKEKGIKFYLDDFGTGYSNMERIMELPFDIIKFDRSLLIASGEENRSRKMVSNLASMFSDMDYSVLYEGVEKETDETMCREMCAAYLQGYRYSKPAPIRFLAGYLNRSI